MSQGAARHTDGAAVVYEQILMSLSLIITLTGSENVGRREEQLPIRHTDVGFGGDNKCSFKARPDVLSAF